MRFICTNCGKRRKLRRHKFSNGHTRCRSCKALVKLDVFGSIGITAARAGRALRQLLLATQGAGEALEELGVTLTKEA